MKKSINLNILFKWFNLYFLKKINSILFFEIFQNINKSYLVMKGIIISTFVVGIANCYIRDYYEVVVINFDSN